jgi:hypothetical protein
MIVSMFLGQKYHGSIDTEDIFVTPATISNNVSRLANHYRSLVRPILIEQAEAGVLTVCPDLWTDSLKKVNYLGLTVYFVTSNYELISFDLCCSRYDEVDKTGASVLKVSKLIKSKKYIFNSFFSRLYENRWIFLDYYHIWIFIRYRLPVTEAQTY